MERTLKFELFGIHTYWKIDTYFSIKRYRYFAIYSNLINKVIGICVDPLDVPERGHCTFVKITKHQFETYGDDPCCWRQLDEIGVKAVAP